MGTGKGEVCTWSWRVLRRELLRCLRNQRLIALQRCVEVASAFPLRASCGEDRGGQRCAQRVAHGPGPHGVGAVAVRIEGPRDEGAAQRVAATTPWRQACTSVGHS